MKRIFLTLLVLCGCGKMEGTGTGNPLTGQDGDSPALEQTVSLQVLEAVCSRIKTCRSANYAACMKAVNDHQGFAPKMGVNFSPIPSGLMLQYLEAAGNLTADRGAAATCLHNINTLACSDSAVQNAYDPASATPFAKSPGVLSADCEGIFGP